MQNLFRIRIFRIVIPRKLQSVLRINPFIALLCFATLCWQCERGPSPALSPEEALNSFVLADSNLKIELVAAEPLVQDPVAISFDEGGRLWVVEMLGFMQDIDGKGELDKVGRISVLFDDDEDGKMDRSIVFLDSLVLPRAVAIVKGGALVAENIPLWFAEDTDGDFKADRKVLIDSTYGGHGMPEHSANGLWRGMDNWYYNAKSSSRYRRTSTGWEKGETEFRGQWGICHDDAGRLFYNYNWSQLHADLVPPNALLANKNHSPSSGIDHGLTLDRKIYPIRSNTAVNRGYVPGTLDEEGKLLEFASACGPLIYRGQALAPSFYGDAFVCEPTANLIKRNRIQEDGFLLNAEAAYEKLEFLASTDERFRPISLSSGPDGALYVVDMYKGIIQHGPYMTPYLRKVTLERQLDRPINMGRIWRITSKDQPGRFSTLAGLDGSVLVSLLDDPNGWTRDMAQRLLVENGDQSTISGILSAIAEMSPKGQLHSLWTLEGLNYGEPEPFLEGMQSSDPFVAQAALRILQQRFKEDPEVWTRVGAFVQGNFDQKDPLLQMQMVFTTKDLPKTAAFEIALRFLEENKDSPIARDVILSSLEDKEAAMLDYVMSKPYWRSYGQDQEIFIEMLATAITNRGNIDEVSGLLAMQEYTETKLSSWAKNALVNGMINHKRPEDSLLIELAEQPKIFKTKSEWVNLQESQLAALAGIFNWPGKPQETMESTGDSPVIDRTVLAEGRRQYVNLCANCHGTQGEGIARFAPPLKSSEWVTGKEEKLAMILLHGMEGPVKVAGKTYDIPDILPVMPSFSTLQNHEIAAIATYIRNTWGHSEPEISSGTIGHIRFRTQGKISPWKATELDTLNFNSDL
ncbi:PVC-type heme-binding CxxCH protein [Poritiphilus flavus]|uniref:PVC-type heme-binding CxxCH protein n=1 Tax=Poritiphilus flavus TaxID=2697053 RepID=UPI001EEA1E41|nr:PVC-type heme-binding CxxCH protein [Poritiphilus flavus]